MGLPDGGSGADAVPFTEFCCRSGGSNLNAGTRTGDSTEPGTSADFTYASGNWVAGTGVFTVASGNPASDGVAVGDFASVYPNGSTVAVFVGRVTARDATTITVSLTICSGTPPTDGTGDRTLKIGGAWGGPSGASDFPFDFLTVALVNTSSYRPRINMKNAASFVVSASINPNQAGPITVQGYATTYGDGGIAVIDGGTTGSAYSILTGTSTCTAWSFVNVKFMNNGNSGTGTMVAPASAIGMRFFQCQFADCRGHLAQPSTTSAIFEECEFWGWNQANSTDQFAINCNLRNAIIRRCIFRDPSASSARTGAINVNGAFASIEYCIFDTATKGSGPAVVIFAGTNSLAYVDGCDFYNNTNDGVQVFYSSAALTAGISNCNFIRNGGYGIGQQGTSARDGVSVYNCGFGAGTEANTSGATNLTNTAIIEGSVTYAANVTPWKDPANGDFTIMLDGAMGTGRGTFPPGSTLVASPDIGAVQSKQRGPLVNRGRLVRC